MNKNRSDIEIQIILNQTKEENIWNFEIEK